MKRNLYIQLGRLGDILNVLPLCLHDFETTGERPVLMVADQFREVLDGVTYVEPLIWHGDFEAVAGSFVFAEQVAAERNLAIICTQIYGRQLWTEEACSSFLRESWSRLPHPPIWGSLPLVFDRRDVTRETHVKRQLLKRAEPGRPYVVLALNGTSSPFPFYSHLSNYLRTKLGKSLEFIDISGFTAPRFFDLLLLLEGAHALVAVDSAVLHLAAAVPRLPVVALITREPSRWHGSAWRPQHIARHFYDECPEAFANIVETVKRALVSERPTIRHVWTHFVPGGERDQDTRRRIAFARSTWALEKMTGVWVDLPFEEQHSKRSSAELGDERPVPYLKDVIDHAAANAPGTDAIAFTNADVCFVPGLTGWILDRMAREGCAFTHRRDFRKLGRTLVSEAEARRGSWYAGSDAFFFTVGWWKKHRDEFPDMLIGREQADEVLRQLVKRHGGGEIRDAIYHEKHPSYWERDGVLQNNRGNQHNRRLARRWFLRTGYAPNDWQWWALPGGSAPAAAQT